MSFLSKILQNFGSHPRCEEPRLAKDSFILHHYAGKVQYTVHNFLDKNRDAVSEELQTFLQSSRNEFIRLLFLSETLGEAVPSAAEAPGGAPSNSETPAMMLQPSQHGTLRRRKLNLIASGKLKNQIDASDASDAATPPPADTRLGGKQLRRAPLATSSRQRCDAMHAQTFFAQKSSIRLATSARRRKRRPRYLPLALSKRRRRASRDPLRATDRDPALNRCPL